MEKRKNQEFVINDSDKNLGTAAAEKKDVIKECSRQLCDIQTYFELSTEAIEMLIAKIRTELLEVINKYSLRNECSKKEKDFLLSKIKGFTIPHFYIIWKILKNPIIGRPIVAGYDWIQTPASILQDIFLKNFTLNSILFCWIVFLW